METSKFSDGWQTLLKSPAVGVALCNLQCIIEHASPALESQLGLGTGTAKGLPLLRLVQPTELDSILNELRRACSGESRAFLFRGHRHNDGGLFTLHLIAEPIGRPHPTGLMLLFSEPTCSEAADCYNNDHRLHMALQNMGKPAAILAGDGSIVWNNIAFSRVMHEDTTAVPVKHSSLPNFDNLMHRAADALKSQGHWQGPLQGPQFGKDSPALHVSLSFIDEGATHGDMLLILSDTSEMHAYAAHLEQLIHYDSLTGLLTRDSFRERLQNCLYRCQVSRQQLVVLFLDLDNFKTVNDSFGHEAGDQILRQAGERMQMTSKEFGSGVDIARLGGDEFAILVPPSDDPLSTAKAFNDDLKQMFIKPFQAGRLPYLLNFSVGGCLGPSQQHTTASDMLHAADQAMYRMKQEGAGDITIEAIDVLEADRQLPAVPTDFDSPSKRTLLEAFFQPIVDLKTNRYTAIEARVRLRDNSNNYWTAKDIFQAMTSEEAARHLDYTVLGQALDAVAHLDGEGLTSLKVAVNLSTATCIHPESVAHIEKLLSNKHVRPSRLRIEIPHSALLQEPPVIISLAAGLQALGVEILIDHINSVDFKGALLDKVPAHALKLHKELITALSSQDATDQRISHICAAAKYRGWQLCAEEVTQMQELNYLRNVDCHEAQGTFINPSMPLYELLPLLKQEWHG